MQKTDIALEEYPETLALLIGATLEAIQEVHQTLVGQAWTPLMCLRVSRQLQHLATGLHLGSQAMAVLAHSPCLSLASSPESSTLREGSNSLPSFNGSYKNWFERLAGDYDIDEIPF